MEVKLSWQGKVHFVGKAREHSIPLDGPPEQGGEDRGVRPMEAILIGLAGCSAYDVVSILDKAQQPLASCEVDVSAERADTIPSVFTKILLHFRCATKEGETLDAKHLERALELSVKKYCSASKMLMDGGVKIDYSYEIAVN